MEKAFFPIFKTIDVFLKNFPVLIPPYLRKKAQENDAINRDILEERDVFYLSDEKVISLSKLKCKDYYNLFRRKR